MKKHYYLNNFYEQLFYKYLAFHLFAVDLKSEYWPQFEPTKNILLNFQRRVITLSMIITVISQFMYLYLHFSEHEFQTLAMMYTIIPVVAIIMLKLILAQTSSYENAMKIFPEKISLQSLYNKTKGTGSTFLEQAIIKTEKYIRWSHAYIYFLILISGTAFLIAPIVRNIENNQSIHNITTRLEVVLHVWMPFDYEFNFYNYLVMQIIITYSTFVGITIFAVFDTLKIMFLFHILGHVKYFKHIVKTLTEEQKNMNNQEIKERLVDITCYYTFIKSILRDVEAAFGWSIVGMYLFNLIGGGIQMYQLLNSGLNTGALLSYGLMTPLNIGELILISFVLEELRTQGDDIPTLIYNLHWEEMSISNQKIVLMILYQTQPTFEFTAAFNTKTGLKPAVNIIKTTFSYYVMIKARV